MILSLFESLEGARRPGLAGSPGDARGGLGDGCRRAPFDAHYTTGVSFVNESSYVLCCFASCLMNDIIANAEFRAFSCSLLAMLCPAWRGRESGEKL